MNQSSLWLPLTLTRLEHSQRIVYNDRNTLLDLQPRCLFVQEMAVQKSHKGSSFSGTENYKQLATKSIIKS